MGIVLRKRLDKAQKNVCYFDHVGQVIPRIAGRSKLLEQQ